MKTLERCSNVLRNKWWELEQVIRKIRSYNSEEVQVQSKCVHLEQEYKEILRNYNTKPVEIKQTEETRNTEYSAQIKTKLTTTKERRQQLKSNKIAARSSEMLKIDEIPCKNKRRKPT